MPLSRPGRGAAFLPGRPRPHRCAIARASFRLGAARRPAQVKPRPPHGWIGALNRIRAALGIPVSDPVRGIGRNVSNLGDRSLRYRRSRNPGWPCVGGRPHQPAAVVIDDHRQVPGEVALVGEISSIPMRRKFANRSISFSVSAQTRA